MEPVHILGSGSIGLFWASSIRSAFPAYPIAVLFRAHHKAKLLEGSGASETTTRKRNEVMVCTMQNRRPRMSNVPVEFIDDEDQKTRGRIRNLILATKAYQATDAIESIISRLKDSTGTGAATSEQDTIHPRIFILSNGALDIREKLQELFHSHQDVPSPHWIMCTTTHGVVKEEEDTNEDDEMEHMIHLTHIGSGSTYLGGHPGMTRLWDQSGLNASLIQNSSSLIDPMEVLLWKKLAGNCFCNPLTALWEVTNGEIMKQDKAHEIRQQVVSEISSIARALNPHWPHEEVSATALDVFVEQVIQDNLKNRSSMYYDVKRGRRTEVDSLNGYVVRKGKELGIATPANETLLYSINEIGVQCSE